MKHGFFRKAWSIVQARVSDGVATCVWSGKQLVGGTFYEAADERAAVRMADKGKQDLLDALSGLPKQDF